LLAAVLSDPRCGGAPARALISGWHTRHQLDERHSSFAYWSPQPADLASILDEVRRTQLPAGAAGESLLDGLRARQIAATLDRGAVPFALIGKALEHAAWGTPANEALGTPETIAAVTAADLAEAIDLLVPRAAVYDASSSKEAYNTPSSDCSAFGARTDVASPWRGGIGITACSASDAVVGVRLAVLDTPPEVLEMMVEVLGNGPDGRLHHEVRHRNQLAYGFTAAAWRQPGSASIGATATVPPEHAAAAVRVLAATVRRLADGVGAEETNLARWRCRAGLLAELDGPFGLVDELRRRAFGLRSSGERLAVMARLGELPGLSFAPLPPAVAAVGPFEEHHREEIARAYEEVQSS
jgi:hypothetical protein